MKSLMLTFYIPALQLETERWNSKFLKLLAENKISTISLLLTFTESDPGPFGCGPSRSGEGDPVLR